MQMSADAHDKRKNGRVFFGQLVITPQCALNATTPQSAPNATQSLACVVLDNGEQDLAQVSLAQVALQFIINPCKRISPCAGLPCAGCTSTRYHPLRISRQM